MADMTKMKVLLDNGSAVKVYVDPDNASLWEWHFQDITWESADGDESGKYGWRGGYTTAQDALEAGLHVANRGGE